MMAEKASKRFDSAERVRVTHVGNPIMVKTSQSEFRAVVQSLTGRKRPPSPSSQSSSSSSAELNWNCDGSPQSKVPRYENEEKYSSILHRPQPTKVSCNTHNINEKVVCLEIQVEDKAYDNEMFDNLESIIDDTSFTEFLPLLL
ncbi:uncharacterized protein LOC131036206 [Cryptomeria japonica]|uniref:uncharacterized protein LOC131036206 n=1 Tax=Cryptomeria japonica TaxID=3369 RepID=UPI0027DA8814|nr:uncharacterized protein LOC131036206 [Cryptomeria japonica]